MSYRIIIMFAGLLLTTLSCSNKKADSAELDALLSRSNLVVWVVNGESGTTNVTSQQTLTDLFSPTNRVPVTSSWGKYTPPGIIIIFSGTNTPRGIDYLGNRTFACRSYYFQVNHTNEIIAWLNESPSEAKK